MPLKLIYIRRNLCATFFVRFDVPPQKRCKVKRKVEYNSGTRNPNFDAQIQALCEVLQRESEFEDADGYFVEIEAAAEGAAGRWAWLESREKEVGRLVNISLKIHLYQQDEIQYSWDIETYNPYFGCSVKYMEWWDDVLIVLYSEKHDTYVAALQVGEEPRFLTVADTFWIYDAQLMCDSTAVDGASGVKVIQLPALARLPNLSWEKARSAGWVPEFLG